MAQKPTRKVKKSFPALTERFRAAYKELSYHQKAEAREAFCSRFKIVQGTCRQKIAGAFGVSENEVTWMEQYAENSAQLNPA